MRIVFMGTPDFAEESLRALLEAGEDVAAAFTQPDKPRGRGMQESFSPVKTLAVERGIPVYQPVTFKDGEVVEHSAQSGEALLGQLLDTDEGSRRIGEIADATARAFRGSASVEELASAPPLKNDEALTEQMARCAEMLFGEKSVYRLREGGMGSEDFASYTYELPCAYLLLGAGTAQEEAEDGEPPAQLLDGSAARRLCGAACRLDVDQALDLLLEQRRAARAGQEEAAIRRMTRTYLEGCRA